MDFALLTSSLSVHKFAVVEPKPAPIPRFEGVGRPLEQISAHSIFGQLFFAAHEHVHVFHFLLEFARLTPHCIDLQSFHFKHNLNKKRVAYIFTEFLKERLQILAEIRPLVVISTARLHIRQELQQVNTIDNKTHFPLALPNQRSRCFPFPDTTCDRRDSWNLILLIKYKDHIDIYVLILPNTS
jgi:hypothetical protein